MSTEENQFIELGRTFHELSKHAGKGDDVDLPGTRRHVKFDELLQELRVHWAALAPKFPNIDDVAIIGIDLTKRSN